MGNIKYIKCIKGVSFGDYNGNILVMKGEVFMFDPNGDGTDFIGVEGKNRCPGMEISFTQKDLSKYFKIIHSKE